MFTNVSMTGTGMGVLILVGVLQWLGISFDANQATTIVKDIVEVGSFVLMVWGQLRRADLSWGFWRKA